MESNISNQNPIRRTIFCGSLFEELRVGSSWLRGLDSNQDNQIQSLVCCRLHHPGAGKAEFRIIEIRCRNQGGILCVLSLSGSHDGPWSSRSPL
jgi:hypothetical protein